MTLWTIIPAFALVMLLGAMSPGPDFAVVTRRAAVSGRRAGTVSAVGVGTGVSVWIIAAATGAAAILAASVTWFTIVKIVGAVYLFIMGAKALRDAWRHGEGFNFDLSARQNVSTWVAFRQGLLCNVLNPKASVFFMALIPQFLPAHASIGQTAVLALVGVTIVMSWFVLVAVAVGSARQIFARRAPRRWLDGATGAVMIGLGLKLATSTS